MAHTAPATSDLAHDAQLASHLIRLGLLAPEQPFTASALTGGVSSDIALIATQAVNNRPAQQFCVKRALSRLKVAAVWEAPISRNAAEAAWMQQVAVWLPEAVPQILAQDAQLGMFAMQYLPSNDYPVWKSALLAGHCDTHFAASVGHSLGIIHSKSAGQNALAQRFAYDSTFEPIRLEPYLRATARKHPDLSLALNTLADHTLAHKQALVHGDVSPKNILCRPQAQGPVFLDAECAWYGDPAFDLAFCLNHFLLKSVHQPQWRIAYSQNFQALVDAYLTQWPHAIGNAVQQRAAHLLPALFLARVDGKSPVEYITDGAQHAAIRQFAKPLIARPLDTLSAVLRQFIDHFHFSNAV